MARQINFFKISFKQIPLTERNFENKRSMIFDWQTKYFRKVSSSLLEAKKY